VLGKSNEIACIVENSEYIKILIALATNDTNSIVNYVIVVIIMRKVKKEAAWILSNCTANSSFEQIASMIQNGVLNCFSDLLGYNMNIIKEIALQGLMNILERILAHVQKNDLTEIPFLVEFENCVEKVISLETHLDESVSAKATIVAICLNKLFGIDGDYSESDNDSVLDT